MPRLRSAAFDDHVSRGYERLYKDKCSCPRSGGKKVVLGWLLEGPVLRNNDNRSFPSTSLCLSCHDLDQYVQSTRKIRARRESQQQIDRRYGVRYQRGVKNISE